MLDDLDEEAEEGEVSRERWMVSYADFVTTLFALFVLLFALALADAHHREGSALKQGYKSVARMIAVPPKAKNVEQRAASATSVPSETATAAHRGANDVDYTQLRALEHKIAASLKGFSAAGVTLHMTDEGLVISLAAARFFPSGDAAINPKQLPILKTIVRQIDGLPNLMRVEGFTDSVPIHTVRYADNWDLSAARAGDVLRYLLANSSLNARRLSLAGYGPYRPVASNATDAGRALNRRVDIVIHPLGWKD